MNLVKFLLAALCLSASFALAAQDRSSWVVSEELIFLPQSQHCHSSSIVELPNGDLLACWFQGSSERQADDVKVLGARLKKGSRQWTPPFIMADTPDLPDCNPVLFLNTKKELFLTWVAVQANEWEGSILMSKISTDYNTNDAPVWKWQAPILLKPDNRFAEEVEIGFNTVKGPDHGWSGYAPKYDKMILEASKDPMKRSFGWMGRLKPLVYADGRIVLPLYNDGFNLGLMAISENDGQSWRPSLPLVGRGPIQPALAICKNGDILAYCRDSGDAPNRVWQSRSTDRGKSWTSATKTEIPTEACVELTALKEGRFAMVLNDDPSMGRNRLSLLLSNDEGKTWPVRVALENDPGNKGQFAYPSAIQGADGKLHITYSFHKNDQRSIKHVVVDPSRLK